MKSPEQHELILSRATAAEALAFIKAVEEIGFNHVWHMRKPFQERLTHTFYLELTMSLDNAKAKIGSVANTSGITLDWCLLPGKL